MNIVRFGDFALQYKTYFWNDKKLTSHDICIAKYAKTDKSRYSDPSTANDEYCWIIASFDRNDKEPEASDVVSCGNRLLEAIETWEDLEKIKKLTDIAFTILQEDAVPVKQNEPAIIKTWKYNIETGLLDYTGDSTI